MVVWTIIIRTTEMVPKMPHVMTARIQENKKGQTNHENEENNEETSTSVRIIASLLIPSKYDNLPLAYLSIEKSL